MHYAKLNLVNAVTIITRVLAGPTAAHDELYYSAANCKPIHTQHWEGGAEGFEWSAGAWFNDDRDKSQILVCPMMTTIPSHSRALAVLLDIGYFAISTMRADTHYIKATPHLVIQRFLAARGVERCFS